MNPTEKRALLDSLMTQRDKLNLQIGDLMRELDPGLYARLPKSHLTRSRERLNKIYNNLTPEQRAAHHAAQIRQQQQDGA